MVSMLASSAVDHGFKPQLSQTKVHKLGICCFAAKQAALLGERAKTGWLSIRVERHVYLQTVVSVI